ncbi:MAG: rod shape-determining protein MreC, partial [Muribaculaceae bacterium]|nr:rod shape-determining protein MreC [Muribaculaceae bacterium]
MRTLFSFLIRHSAWFVFMFYVVLSCIMLFHNNPYQHHVYITSAGRIASTVYGTANNITGYFHLREINEDLQERNSSLEMELIDLRNRLTKLSDIVKSDSLGVDSSLSRYEFIIAHVINNSITHPHNFLTIEKGSLDGVKPEMGVVDHNGVVG